MNKRKPTNIEVYPDCTIGIDGIAGEPFANPRLPNARRGGSRGGGRPKSTPDDRVQQRAFVVVRTTATRRARWNEAAKVAGLPLSELVRQLLDARSAELLTDRSVPKEKPKK